MFNSILHVSTPHRKEISVTEGLCHLICEISAASNQRQSLVVFWQTDYILAREILGPTFPIFCYESDILTSEYKNMTLDELEASYPTVNWGPLIASEREFSDYSFLFGSTGITSMNPEDVWQRVAQIGSFVDHVFRKFSPNTIMTVVADNIFTMTTIALAESKDINIIIPQISQVTGKRKALGGFFGRTRFLDSYRFIRAYESYLKRPHSQAETERAYEFERFIKRFDIELVHKEMGVTALRRLPFSPRWKSLLREVFIGKYQRNNDAELFRWSLKEKIIANFTRCIRYMQVRHYLKVRAGMGIKKYVFFPLHFQPEASTLVNGLFWSNQIAVIEQISKSLPLGYLLIVKEHEKGRGNRPLWQYKHIESFYNVRVIDAPAASIISKCDAVITVSGTAAVEAVAHRKPIIVLGYKHFYYPEFFLRVTSINKLPALLKQVLILRSHNYDDHLVHSFYLGWMDAQFEVVPIQTRLHELAPLIIDELSQDYTLEKCLLKERIDAIL